MCIFRFFKCIFDVVSTHFGQLNFWTFKFLNSSNFKKEHGDLAPDLVGVTELTSPYFFVPPSGTTAERPEECEPGTLRFNTDIGSLEVFRGDGIGWEIIQRRESLLSYNIIFSSVPLTKEM